MEQLAAETTVAWEGDRASGTVQLAATGRARMATPAATSSAVLSRHEDPDLERTVPALEVAVSPTQEPEPVSLPFSRA